MTPHVLVESEGDIMLSETAPTYLWEYKIPETRSLGASGDFGDILLQEAAGDHYSVWYNNFQFKKSEWVVLPRQKAVYALRFILNNTFYYTDAKNITAPMYEWAYNFVYVPEEGGKINFKDKMYGNLEIHFSYQYLSLLAPQYQHLADWLKKSGKGIATSLCKINQVAATSMIRCISELLNSPYPGALRSIHYDALVTEILMMVLQETATNPRNKPIRFTSREVETLYALKSFITKNMDRPLDIEDLAKRFDGTPRTLKRRFYTLFGIKLYNYLLEIRMEQASLLLLETDTSIESIAALTGYRSFANFSTAFKKYYGHPPKYFRSR